MAPKTEPARPSVEAILTDIHNTLTEGFAALQASINEGLEEISTELAKFNENFEKAAAEDVTVTIPAGTLAAVKTPEVKDHNTGETKPLKESEPIPDDEIPKFLRKYVEAHPGCKAADLVKEFKVSLNKATEAIKQYAKPAPKAESNDLPKSIKKVEEKKAGRLVTVEMLRAKISEFSEVFGMNEALAVNEQKGGARKVSQIPVEKYASVFDEMESRLTLRREVEASGNGTAAREPEPTATIDDVRKVAQAFINKYNDPAFRELLKKFGGAKISEIKPENYAALIEALANA
jgi:hypothetical protein